ncbi:hypothetical protein I4U23_006546 [Adineta vaga]|nr:hypothetical protein I4U23_006546 [Adineta vaga]
METNNLNERLLRAEKSIEFLQNEHASTLADLHQELNKWQRKYNDLTFQLTFNNRVIDSNDDIKLQSTVEQLENELLQNQIRVKQLNKILEEKDKRVNDYKNRLRTQEQKQRSSSIIRSTNQFIREKQQQDNICHCLCLGHMILPNKYKTFKNTNEQRHISTSHIRSSSLTDRTNQERTKSLFIGQRPSPLRSIESKEKQLLTKRQHYQSGTIALSKVVVSRSTMKFSTVLPPITNKKVPLKATIPCEGEA